MNRAVLSSILFIGAFIAPVFFGVSGIIGYQYTGQGNDPTYLLYVVNIFISLVVIYIFSLFKNGFQKIDIVFFGVIFFIIFFHLLWNFLSPLRSVLFPSQFFIFLSIGLSGALSGLVVIKFDLIKEFRKIIDPIALFFSFSIIVFAITPFISGLRMVSIGGASYQFFSYFSAVTFGFLIYVNYLQKNNERYAFFQGRFYYFLSHILILCCFIGVVLGGGRGAFLVLLVYSFIAIRSLISVKGKSKRRYLKDLVKILVLCLIFLASIIYFSEDEFIKRGLHRVFEYIDSGGLNIEDGSSGRLDFYNRAIEAISEQPFVGYGIFNVKALVIQPHNFFLDVFLQYGVILGFGLISIMLLIIYKVVSFQNENLKFILFLGIYPAVYLQVSGSYLTTSEFWFVFIAILSSCFKPRINSKEHNKNDRYKGFI